MRAFDDIHQELGQPTFNGVYFLLFLPGLHYWTGAIGKDAPIFLGIAMCVWAAFHLQRRYLVFAAGVAIALVVRPHVALMALIAVAMALLLGRNTTFLTRAGLLVVVVAGIGSVAGLVEGTFSGLTLSSADSVSAFLESRGQVGEDSGADVGITNAAFPVKLISLLFRPFFIDAEGALGYVASLENVVLLAIFIILVRRFRTGLALFRSVLFARFALIFFVVLTLLLAMVNYNVGLGLRQKMMMMPALLAFFAALLAVRNVQTGQVYGPRLAAYPGAANAVQNYRRA